MEQFGITAFDIIVGVILALSTIVALSRGFVSEVLSIAAWIGAGIVTYQLFTPVLPVVQEAIPNELLAEAATIVVLFLVPLIIFRVIAGLISGAIGSSRLGLLDRFLGVGFGVARGAALVAAGYLILSLVVVPDKQPAWIQTAFSIEYVKQGANTLKNWLPEDLIERGSEEAELAIDGASSLRDNAAGSNQSENDLIKQIINATQDTK